MAGEWRAKAVLTELGDYAEKYESVRMERQDGILQVNLHTSGGPLVASRLVHGELPDAFADIGNDLENLCVILTGTGDGFYSGRAPGLVSANRHTAEDWYRVVREGTKLLLNFLDIDVPVIAAVNGPCVIHSELVLMSSIVLANPRAVFQDAPHFWNGMVPGDGVAPIWLKALGPNRGSYFLLTGQQLDVQEAYDLGVVNEIVPEDRLLDRAWELAREIVKRSPLTLRYTRIVLAAEFRRLLTEQLRYSLVLEGAAHTDLDGDLGLLSTTTGIDGTGFARTHRRDGRAG
jgi:enoyl-CoA hydratase/carnithine racemase